MIVLPPFAISVRQPWAYAITHGGKDVENRSWSTRFRGPVCIHAAKGITRDEAEDFRDFIRDAGLRGPWCEGRMAFDLPRGGIVGTANVVDCVSESASPWFMGEYGFVLADVRPLDLIPCRGALGFFRHNVTLDSPQNVTSIPAGGEG